MKVEDLIGKERLLTVTPKGRAFLGEATVLRGVAAEEVGGQLMVEDLSPDVWVGINVRGIVAYLSEWFGGTATDTEYFEELESYFARGEGITWKSLQEQMKDLREALGIAIRRGYIKVLRQSNG